MIKKNDNTKLPSTLMNTLFSTDFVNAFFDKINGEHPLSQFRVYVTNYVLENDDKIFKDTGFHPSQVELCSLLGDAISEARLKGTH